MADGNGRDRTSCRLGFRRGSRSKSASARRSTPSRPSAVTRTERWHSSQVSIRSVPWVSIGHAPMSLPSASGFTHRRL
jgi:hypothetical protein